MIDKLLTGFLVVLLIAFPTATADSGYVVLTSHLHGVEDTIFGWVLFLGGFVSIPFFAAAIVELVAPSKQ